MAAPKSLTRHGLSQMARSDLIAWATERCLLEHLDDVETLSKSALVRAVLSSLLVLEVEEDRAALWGDRQSRPLRDLLDPPREPFVPRLDGVEPWVNLSELDDELGLVRRDSFYCTGHVAGERWVSESPASFYVAAPRYDPVTDGLCGTTFHRLPAAQQYALKLTAWVTDQRRHSAPVTMEPF